MGSHQVFAGTNYAPPPLSHACTYVSDGDTNGAFYFIGTAYASMAWANPQSNGLTVLNNGGMLGGSLSNITNRAADDNYGGDNPNSYYTFQLGTGRSLSLTDWSYRSRAVNFSSLPTAMKIQGSNTGNGIDWADINAQTGITFSGVSEYKLYTLSASSAYKHFRLIQTAATTDANNFFTIGELELYGTFYYPA